MPKVTWSKSAMQDIDRFFEFLINNSPNAAYRCSQSIISAARKLEDFPHIGRPLSKQENYRELIASFGHGGYVLRYRLTSQGDVIVVRVWHSKEKR